MLIEHIDRDHSGHDVYFQRTTAGSSCDCGDSMVHVTHYLKTMGRTTNSLLLDRLGNVVDFVHVILVYVKVKV